MKLGQGVIELMNRLMVDVFHLTFSETNMLMHYAECRDSSPSPVDK